MDIEEAHHNSDSWHVSTS